jgi:ABC-2 type transport system ATP-binding protein
MPGDARATLMRRSWIECQDPVGGARPTRPSWAAAVIVAEGLTKRYGDVLAVDDLSFSVPPGRVTGFLGPNGAGKTTTMRMLLGLARPSSGRILTNGRVYVDHPAPMREVGALLDAGAVHPGRRARDHLRWLARSNAIPLRRVDEVLEAVGIDSVATKRIGTFSLGMSQRLGIAAALLGDPDVLVFDEPVNGLDPEGIVWIRSLFRALAQEGRTVFVSSHLMSEMALTADHVIVIGRGKLLADAPVDDLTHRSSGNVLVRTPARDQFAALLIADGASVDADEDDALRVSSMTAPEIGAAAARYGIVLHELTPQHASLEEAFFELTGESVEYHAEIRGSGPRAASEVTP